MKIHDKSTCTLYEFAVMVDGSSVHSVNDGHVTHRRFSDGHSDGDGHRVHTRFQPGLGHSANDGHLIHTRFNPMMVNQMYTGQWRYPV